MQFAAVADSNNSSSGVDGVDGGYGSIAGAGANADPHQPFSHDRHSLPPSVADCDANSNSSNTTLQGLEPFLYDFGSEDCKYLWPPWVVLFSQAVKIIYERNTYTN